MPALASWTPQVRVAAPNLWQLPVPAAALQRARGIFEEALMHLFLDGLVAELDAQFVPCKELRTGHGHSFFAMRGGSSTNQALRDSSDLAWVSVNDESTFDVFAEIFAATGVGEALSPLIDLADKVALYSCFFVVRSRCSDLNLHTDWPDSVGNNAFTLLTPIDDYSSADGFHLLYEDRAGALQQYRYQLGEAICFSSRFVHGTEPGKATPDARGRARPHAFLCFTFGSDKAAHWPEIQPTIGGYQSRFLRRFDGASELTDIGRYLQRAGAV